MVQLKLTDEEARTLLNLIENYMPELAVEIHRTEDGSVPVRSCYHRRDDAGYDRCRTCGGSSCPPV